MKKATFLIAACFMFSLGIFAEGISVKSIEKLEGTEGKNYNYPTIAPDGSYLLLTSKDYTGLTQYDLLTKEFTKLTDAKNAGNYPKISDGGKVVVFRDVEYRGKLRYTSIKQIDLGSKRISTIDEPARAKYAFDFIGGTLKVAKGKSIESRRLVTDIKAEETSVIAAIENEDLVVYVNNKRAVLNPNGDGSYIWPSVSPDKKHIVYYSVDKGSAYVVDIAGGNMVKLGYVAAPVWLNDGWVVGMQDEDDGHLVTSSKLVAVSISGGAIQELATPDSKIVMYPSAANNRIAYEADGAIYLMTIE